MMNTNVRGIAHRKHQMMALRQLLGFPMDAPSNSGLAFAAVDEPNDGIITAIAQKAIMERQDTLVHCYESSAAKDVMLTILILRTPTGAEMLPVKLVERTRTRPLELITADRKRCFALDSRLQVREVKAPSLAKLPKALAAASARYEAVLAQPHSGEAIWDPQVVIFERGPFGLAA